jgi:hypothetical protein
MRQYCSVCKAQLEMSVVSDASEDGVLWLKCPRCKGILPHMETEVGGADSAEAGAVAASSVSTSLDDIDVSKARPYLPHEVYEVGDVVHHRGWDDYGVVASKDALPGNRSAIVIHFVEQGEVRLIEGAD